MLCISTAYNAVIWMMRCPFVSFPRSRNLWKQINISSKFFHHRVARPFYDPSFPYQTLWQYSDRDPYNEGVDAVECTSGGHKSRFSTNIWLSIDHCCSTNNNCDRPPRSLPLRLPHISKFLFITTSMDEHDTRRRE